MSSELDRLLREARDTLPAPDEQATERARRQSVAALGRHAARTRILVLLGAMLVTALLLGVTAGSLTAPSVTAAQAPAAVGFVPEPGWFALQSPPPAIEGQQTVAVAANVAFANDDVANGFVEPSGLPYSTLLSLPPRGVVIVASMTPAVPQHRAPVRVNPYYPTAELPLSFREATPFLRWGTQVRPDAPLANYQLHVNVGNHNVDVVFYFGEARPSDAARAAAQRQLEGLVLRPKGNLLPTAPRPATRSALATEVIDRTYTCETVLLGGIYEVRNRAHSGIRSGSTWSKLPYAVAATGGWAGPLTGLPNAPNNSLAWVTAGAPSASTTVGSDAEVFPVLGGGTLGVNTSLCRPAKARVALTANGLRGGIVSPTAVGVDCVAPRRVLVRLRATVRGTASLRERARIFAASNAPVLQAKLALRTPAGKLLAYADVSESGRTRLFTAKGCARQ